MISKELLALNFHDSTIREISIKYRKGHDRVCSIDIDYYNWENNQSGKSWQWKRLIIHFGYLAHFEFSAPDMINRAQDLKLGKV